MQAQMTGLLNEILELLNELADRPQLIFLIVPIVIVGLLYKLARDQPFEWAKIKASNERRRVHEFWMQVAEIQGHENLLPEQREEAVARLLELGASLRTSITVGVDVEDAHAERHLEADTGTVDAWLTTYVWPWVGITIGLALSLGGIALFFIIALVPTEITVAERVLLGAIFLTGSGGLLLRTLSAATEQIFGEAQDANYLLAPLKMATEWLSMGIYVSVMAFIYVGIPGFFIYVVAVNLHRGETSAGEWVAILLALGVPTLFIAIKAAAQLPRARRRTR